MFWKYSFFTFFNVRICVCLKCKRNKQAKISMFSYSEYFGLEVDIFIIWNMNAKILFCEL